MSESERMKALSLFVNVGMAEANLRAMGVAVTTAEQSSDCLEFREDETAHLEACGCKCYIKEDLRKAS